MPAAPSRDLESNRHMVGQSRIIPQYLWISCPGAKHPGYGGARAPGGGGRRRNGRGENEKPAWRRGKPRAAATESTASRRLSRDKASARASSIASPGGVAPASGGPTTMVISPSGGPAAA